MKLSKKKEILEILKKDFSEHETAFMVNFRGLNVTEITDLRSRLREKTCSLRVVKNTLSIRAAEGTMFETMKEHFQGPTAIAFTKDDPVSLAKIITDYAKDHDRLELKHGLLNGKPLTPEEIKAVAKLPSREVLIAQLIGLIQAPIRNLLSVIQGPNRSLVTALAAITDKKKQ